jgi:hypothetical protein
MMWVSGIYNRLNRIFYEELTVIARETIIVIKTNTGEYVVIVCKDVNPHHESTELRCLLSLVEIEIC